MNLTRKMGMLFLIVCLSSVPLSSLFAEYKTKATQVLVTKDERRVDDAFFYEKDKQIYTYVFAGTRTHYEHLPNHFSDTIWGDILYYTVYSLDKNGKISETVKQTKISDHAVGSSAVLIPGKDENADMVCVMYVDHDDSDDSSTHTIYYKLGEINPDFTIDFGPQTKVSSKFDYKQLTAAYCDELNSVILIANDSAFSNSENYERFYLLGGKVNKDSETIAWSMSGYDQEWDRGHQMQLSIRDDRVILTHEGTTKNYLYFADGKLVENPDGTIGIHWYHPNQKMFSNDDDDDCLNIALIPEAFTGDNIGIKGLYHGEMDRSKIYQFNGTIPNSPDSPDFKKGNVIAYGNITYGTKNDIFINHKLLISQTPDANGTYLVALVAENASDDKNFPDGQIKLAYGHLIYVPENFVTTINWISWADFDEENSACKPIQVGTE